MDVDHGRFEVPDEAAARRIILTGPADRWTPETKWTLDLIKAELGPSYPLLDYGCGIGRLAGPLAEGGPVVGADTSVSMRHLGGLSRPKVTFVAPFELKNMRPCCSAISVFCLQHASPLTDAINILYEAIQKGAKLLVINELKRFVPTLNGSWGDDGLDVWAQLEARFKPSYTDLQSYPFNSSVRWQTYQKL